jgi:hypothetical protein
MTSAGGMSGAFSALFRSVCIGVSSVAGFSLTSLLLEGDHEEQHDQRADVDQGGRLGSDQVNGFFGGEKFMGRLGSDQVNGFFGGEKFKVGGRLGSDQGQVGVRPG